MSKKRRRHAHADLSFGPRPGPADRRWGAVMAEEDKGLQEATLRPLAAGPHISQLNSSAVVKPMTTLVIPLIRSSTP